MLTHLPLVSRICLSELIHIVSIDSGNGLSPVQCQAITRTNAGLSSIEPLRTNFSEIRIKLQRFSCMKMHLNLSSAKWRPFCPGGWVKGNKLNRRHWVVEEETKIKRECMFIFLSCGYCKWCSQRTKNTTEPPRFVNGLNTAELHTRNTRWSVIA